jgi:hypothetical protein
LLNTVGAADGIRLRPWEEALADYIQWSTDGRSTS